MQFNVYFPTEEMCAELEILSPVEATRGEDDLACQSLFEPGIKQQSLVTLTIK